MFLVLVYSSKIALKGNVKKEEENIVREKANNTA